MLKSRIIAAVLLLLAFSGTAISETRKALVIGNDAYQNVAVLQKAVQDADAMAGTLRGLGFEVTPVRNSARREMNLSIQRFIRSVDPGDVAMVFYAGHGVEIDGENFLLPTDIPNARVGEEGFVKGESISLNGILDGLKARNARVNIVILDACRNNPFERIAGRSLGATRGLARIASPGGTFVMYSADAGEEALDRLGDSDSNPNSVFTRTLIPLLKTPGYDLVRLAREVRRQVRKLAATVRHTQTPAYYDAVLGDFHFSAPKEAQPPALSQPAVSSIQEDFNAATTINTREAWDLFLQKHGTASESIYVQLARTAQQKLALGVFQEPAVTRPAQNVCTHKTNILRFADTILELRGKMNRLRSRRFGARAAYLKLRYGELPFAEGRALLKPLVQDGVRDAKALEAIHSIASFPVPERPRLIGGAAKREFSELGRFVWRAIVLKDEGKTFLAFVKELREPGEANREFESRYFNGMSVPYAVIDQTDAFKSAFARHAEAAGELTLAAGLLATQTRLDQYHAFMRKHAADQRLQKFAGAKALQASGLLAHHDTGPALWDIQGATSQMRLRRQSQSVTRASYVSGEQDMLNVFLNMTGEWDAVQDAANAFYRKVQTRELTPLRDPEASWLFLFRELTRVAGRQKTDKTLSSFAFPSTRHYAGLARDSIDWMIAKEALSEFVRGISALPAVRPALLSEKVNWEMWTGIAKALAGNKVEPGSTKAGDEDASRIAVELLHLANRYDELATLVQEHFKPADAAKIFQDIMMRLDRRCAGFAAFPGQALMLAGEPAYRFPNKN